MKDKVIRLQKQTTPSIAAVNLTAEINSIYDSTVEYVLAAQAKMMEKLWRLRQEFDNDLSFTGFVGENTKIRAAQANTMVLTWDAARANREVRELAQRDPSDAMRFVSQLIEVDAEDIVDAEPEVARLLSLSPRKRARAIRELIDTKKSVEAGHHPADRERIKALEAERDAAVKALDEKAKVTNLADAPKIQLTKYAEDCDALLQRVREFAAASDQRLAATDFSALEDEILMTHQERMAQFERELVLLAEGVRNQWLHHVREVF